ncbi:hypothetical protein OGAPHI_001990 [Ogataea philodendri]|uniref:Dynein heavy chain, cytoplasmic n=1 Tax=Ogataea philodendri TaxID=1378263 RepID=A0A9P8T6W4_9ASCO|nr:uncharacterized protein OGAPHI_001990 [Ogataea philodendri]KAH3668236.1 hypothetical protein OGAPHI_001990 [Ogataea philodendri]
MRPLKLSDESIRDHSIVIQDSKLSVRPPLEESEEKIVSELNKCISVVTSQKCLLTDEFDVNIDENQKVFPELQKKLTKRYFECISQLSSIMTSAGELVNKWLQLQSLWSVDFEDLKQSFGSNIEYWRDALLEVKSLKDAFDTFDTFTMFGPVKLEYGQAQWKVSAQYNAWQRQILEVLARNLASKIKTFLEQVRTGRKKLESAPIDFGSAKAIISLIDIVHHLKLQRGEWDPQIDTIDSCNRLLVLFRMKFSSDWVHFEQLSSEYQLFEKLLDSKTNQIFSNMNVVVQTAENEAASLRTAIEALHTKWENEKPLGKKLASETALSSLDSFKASCQHLNESRSKLLSVARLLDLSIVLKDSITPILSEINDLKEFWSAISGLQSSLANVRDQEWKSVTPMALKKTLEEILANSRNQPIAIRQYSAFEEFQSNLKTYIKAIPLIGGLCSDAINDRHWSTIFEELSMRKVPSKLRFGDVLDLDFANNEKYFKTIIHKAQGEKNLESSIENIQKNWEQLSFQLFQFNPEFRLIKGWEILFQTITEDLNSLWSMKMSPYYPAFEKSVGTLEEKLCELQLILDLWIEVQRQWIYLSGVFEKNDEIKKLLPLESNRFFNTSAEFHSLMKNVYKSTLVMEVRNITNVKGLLEKIQETLEKIKKSLIGYLEKQRDVFPRFYFIGNEELLEIVGNSSNVRLVSTYLQKMFTGVADTVYNSDTSCIESVISPEGEKLQLKSPVSLIEFPHLTDWLHALEIEIKNTLALSLDDSLKLLPSIYEAEDPKNELVHWIDLFPNQILLLSIQIFWTQLVETTKNLQSCVDRYNCFLSLFADMILQNLTSLQRRKYENLIIEIVHQRDVLDVQKEHSLKSFEWKSQQRYYFDVSNVITQRVVIKQGNWQDYYGFEYLGAPARLVYTSLMDTCFLAMSEALNQNLGGSLVGPAGTGKTESIKALGQNLGMMVLVFCCDETFDFQSVSRILIGICRVGSWCCFDEFNRLDKRMLSAISTQIEKIENALASKYPLEIEILAKKFEVQPRTGVFITSNPNYAGRSTLPDNLKTKYREFSVVQPDASVISEVILISQGFDLARDLGEKVVSFFASLESNCSSQPHYDFGLRALKSTLSRCGAFRRAIKDDITDPSFENRIMVHSLKTVTLPKLLAVDEPIFEKNISIFGTQEGLATSADQLVPHLRDLAAQNGFVASSAWIKKALQLYEIQESHHGFMMVGEAGSGKTVLFQSLLESMKRTTGKDNSVHIIDPKVLGKELLYGSLDYATREWTDGVFTSILRRVELNLRGEKSKNVWIVFDGDVDPNWVENLNSVLDDNKILTLPSGERIALPSNLKIVFEVQDLNFATPATVSRCGIVWFGDKLFEFSDYYTNLLHSFKNTELENEDMVQNTRPGSVDDLRSRFADSIEQSLPSTVLFQVWTESKKSSHIMDRGMSPIKTLFGLLSDRFERLVNSQTIVHNEDITSYVMRAVLHSLVWAFAGDSPLSEKQQFSLYLQSLPQLSQYSTSDLLYSEISVSDYEWKPTSVAEFDLEPHTITRSDVVIPTMDTTVHENLIFSLIRKHETVILCGPPGSGKTMTLMAALRKSHRYIFVGVNFSKDTTPDLVIKTLEQHCVYTSTPLGIKLVPSVPEKWLVLFCDEINLPAFDSYGSQTTIAFLRQLVEQGGFWRKKDGVWVTLGNIQIVGACNPPTDPGRNALSSRFLRHSSVIMVDYPGEHSLTQIYSTFNSALLKCVPDLRGYVQPLTNSMIQVYNSSRTHFTTRAHYIYSPRELTRWVRGIYEAVRASSHLNLEQLIRLWAHEALRLFLDRLVDQDEREWTVKLIESVASKNFPHLDLETTLKQPILYSGWLSYDYAPVTPKELGAFVDQRLKVFSEEETNVSLVLYPDLLDHVLRIDRALKNSQGHMILVGPSGSGKTTLAKFVAWINGLYIHQLIVSRKYTLAEFDSTLRELLRRAAEGTKVCFIIDESSILETEFLERMNTLLANAEVPGLFEGEEFSTLMTICSQRSQEQGLFLDSDDELYSWFTGQVANNFHVVFTITDPYSTDAPPLISSPALFNRCVISWMGDWTSESLEAVAKGLLQVLPINNSQYHPPVGSSVDTLQEAVVDIFVKIHRGFNSYKPTPNQFFSLINNFISSFNSQEAELQEHQSHINVGLDRLKETFLEVKELNKSLSVKRHQLTEKNKEAREMLDKMITDQNEAERKQEASIEIHSRFEEQEKYIRERRSLALEDLEKVEPLILEAQRGVKNIKKQHLTELRSMNNPPEAVKITLESVCILLGYDVSTWRDVQLIIRRDDFIASIVGFDSEVHLTKELADFMESEYISRPSYNFESVNRASKACGPLLLWVEAQLRYASVIEKVQPLKDEVRALENELVDTKAKLIALDGMIQDLEQSIEDYKEKYSEVIRQSEKIKTEMQDVENKVERSTMLLESLRDEKDRWGSSVVDFQKQRDCLVGNTLLGTAYMSYLGTYSELERRKYSESWKSILSQYSIAYEPTLDFKSWALKPDQEYIWQQNGLPNDELFIENTMMLSKDERYPFILDPSGLMINFLVNTHTDLVVTSFLDDGYLKLLENCIRFGGHILIQDGEYYDPLISRLIAKDIQTSGGRSLVRLGSKEIDLSPNFRLFVHTKDSSAKIAPFLQSRMNVLNYTFTSSSLVNQALDMTLNSENPQLEKQLVELSKVNGEYKDSLYNLENDLLKNLSDTRVSILDNDELVKKLESIKSQAASIQTKLSQSSALLEEVTKVRNEYLPLAESYCQIQLLLNRLWELNSIYQFASNHLVVVFKKMLKSSHGKTVEHMISALGEETYRSTANSLIQEDRSIFEQLLKDIVGEFDSSREYELAETLEESSLFLLRASGGFDAAATINSLAKSHHRELSSYSMGSSEGLEVARRLFVSTMKSGGWLLVENVHMSPEFIEIIPKLLEGEKRPGFHLFLSCQVDSQISSTVSKLCTKFVFESDPGIKTVLEESLLKSNAAMSLNNVAHPEHARLYVLLAWFYGLLKERLRFVPIGFSKSYEFTEADLACAQHVLDQVIADGVAWDVLSNMFGRVVFGGKVTDSGDLAVIMRVSRLLFSPGVLDSQPITLDGSAVSLLRCRRSGDWPRGPNGCWPRYDRATRYRQLYYERTLRLLVGPFVGAPPLAVFLEHDAVEVDVDEVFVGPAQRVDVVAAEVRDARGERPEEALVEAAVVGGVVIDAEEGVEVPGHVEQRQVVERGSYEAGGKRGCRAAEEARGDDVFLESGAGVVAALDVVPFKAMDDHSVEWGRVAEIQLFKVCVVGQLFEQRRDGHVELLGVVVVSVDGFLEQGELLEVERLRAQMGRKLVQTRTGHLVAAGGDLETAQLSGVCVVEQLAHEQPRGLVVVVVAVVWGLAQQKCQIRGDLGAGHHDALDALQQLLVERQRLKEQLLSQLQILVNARDNRAVDVVACAREVDLVLLAQKRHNEWQNTRKQQRAGHGLIIANNLEIYFLHVFRHMSVTGQPLASGSPVLETTPLLSPPTGADQSPFSKRSLSQWTNTIRDLHIGNMFRSKNVQPRATEIYYSVFRAPPDIHPLTKLPQAGFLDLGPTTRADFEQVVASGAEAIELGIGPQLISAGSSGSYFVYNANYEPIGVFKPQDEEPYGPLSPKMTKWIHRNFFPCFFGRSCLIPNTGYIAESATSLLDRQLQTFIVPYTDIVTLSCDKFYYPMWERVGAYIAGKPLRPKVGSFQLFLHGYQGADEFFKQYPLPHQSQSPSSEFQWTPETLQQLQHEIEKLVILDFIVRNTDRGLDNWMLKIEHINGRPQIRLGAIDNGLSLPWKHPNEWRSFPFGWLFLPISIIGRPFSAATRKHFLPLLTSKEWWEDTSVLLREMLSRDRGFKERMFRKQLAVLKGQAWNVVQTLLVPGQSPLDLARKPRMIVQDSEIEVPLTSPIPLIVNAMDSPFTDNSAPLGQSLQNNWNSYLTGEIDESKWEESNTTILDQGIQLVSVGTKTVIVERLQPSHVIHGYVGNKAATFPLQMLGWNVDVLNTVNFSNHTGYGKFYGEVVTGEKLAEMYAGLKQIGVKYNAVLTGYIHGADSLAAVGEMCTDVKKAHPDCLWLLDPVMGDDGQIYVSQDVIPVYRKIVHSGLVDVITPNQLELELLLDLKITDKDSLFEALQTLHTEHHVKHVVVSSLFLCADKLGLDPDPDHDDCFYCCVSSTDMAAPIVFAIPKLDSYFTGVGDLFSALLVDRLYRLNDLAQAANQVQTVMAEVLGLTRQMCWEALGTTVKGKIGDAATMKECELRVVEARHLYAGSTAGFKAVQLSRPSS